LNKFALLLLIARVGFVISQDARFFGLASALLQRSGAGLVIGRDGVKDFFGNAVAAEELFLHLFVLDERVAFGKVALLTLLQSRDELPLELELDSEINQSNKQTHKQTNKQINKQINKQTNKQAINKSHQQANTNTT
jgi:hypothetical protein